MLKKYGLLPTMVPGCGTIPEGFNKVENHAKFEAIAHELIDQCAAAGAPNMIGLTGERKGQDSRKGVDNCVTFLNKIKSHLEDKNITISVEYLNSKVNHKDYDFDHMAYGVELCKRVNSPRVKILVRHVSRSDHGRRHHPYDAGEHPAYRPFPHGRQSGPP